MNLSHLFRFAKERLVEHQQELNRADAYNGNHGDHMVEIFEVAVRAAGQDSRASLSGDMQRAAEMLEALPDNGSAQIYAQGLNAFSQAFERHQVSLQELVNYVRGLTLREQDGDQEASAPEISPEVDPTSSAEVLKALVEGLTGWRQGGSTQESLQKSLDMGTLFELGMIYMQAKRRGGSRLEVLSEAAVSASPLNQVAHRTLSGKLAILALLQAMSAGAPKDRNS